MAVDDMGRFMGNDRLQHADFTQSHDQTDIEENMLGIGHKSIQRAVVYHQYFDLV